MPASISVWRAARAASSDGDAVTEAARQIDDELQRLRREDRVVAGLHRATDLETGGQVLARDSSPSVMLPSAPIPGNSVRKRCELARGSPQPPRQCRSAMGRTLAVSLMQVKYMVS